MDTLQKLVENLGKKHIKLLLIRLEAITTIDKEMRKIILDQVNDLIRDIQDNLK